MGTQRTAWHFFFSILLRTFGPSWIEVRDEVTLADERPRLDYLLLRKTSVAAADDPGKTLRGLWPHLGLVTIVEFKSIARPYRSGNLDRLWGYVHLYYADEHVRSARRDELRAVLVVPARSPALLADVDAMGLRWKDLGAGYWQIGGGLFSLYLVELDVVAKQEGEHLVRLFSHETEHTLEARRFWAQHVGTKEAGMSVQDLEGYDEVMQKLLDGLTPKQRLAGLAPEEWLADIPLEQRLAGLDPAQRLAGLDPEQRLAGLDPEQRLAGLDPAQRLAGLEPEQAILALPNEVLRGFSEEYLGTLSEGTRATIQKRLGR